MSEPENGVSWIFSVPAQDFFLSFFLSTPPSWRCITDMTTVFWTKTPVAQFAGSSERLLQCGSADTAILPIRERRPSATLAVRE